MEASFLQKAIFRNILGISKIAFKSFPSHLRVFHNQSHISRKRQQLRSLRRGASLDAIMSSAVPQQIVFSGPSGAGKSTILKRLFAEFPDRFGFSVSHTTRSPRPGEQYGREYFFVTPEGFEELVASGGFIEHAQFGQNSYGTSTATVEAVGKEGKTCLLDIEMEGVKQIKASTRLNPKYVFIAPPSLEELESRIRKRATNTDEDIRRRLAQARVEMEYSQVPGVHDRIIVNDDLEKAYKEVKDFVMSHLNSSEK